MAIINIIITIIKIMLRQLKVISYLFHQNQAQFRVIMVQTMAHNLLNERRRSFIDARAPARTGAHDNEPCSCTCLCTGGEKPGL